MYKILICDEFLNYNYSNIFPSFIVDVAYSEEDILNLTYKNEYDLYIVNFYFYNTIRELKDIDDKTTTIFIDQFYSIYNLKQSFLIADDYIAKPLNIEELKIRVEYHYKKIYNEVKNIISYNGFYYHSLTKQLFLKKERIKLSPNEIKIIELFLFNLNKPISKDNIFDTIGSYSDGTLRVYISKIKKLGFLLEYNRITFSYTLVGK